jgi:ankyrin repeat protein
VRELLDLDPSLANARTATGESAALMAAYYRRGDIAELLIERGAQLSMFEAAALGQARVVRNWIDADPGLLNACSADGFTALALAAYFGHVEVVLYLLTRKAEVNAVANNAMRVMPLHSAVAGGHLQIARVLVAEGADVNAPQHMGWRPLHAAARRGDADIVSMLLEHGADPMLANDEGLTPLELSRQHGHEALACLLARAQGG